MSALEANENRGVTNLRTQTQINQEATILVLEKTLEAARAGQIAAVALAYVRADRLSTSQAWSSCDCVPALIGAVTTMTMQLVQSAVMKAVQVK